MRNAGVGGYLAHNITAYFNTAVQLAYKLTGSGTPADSLIHKIVGGKVGGTICSHLEHACMHATMCVLSTWQAVITSCCDYVMWQPHSEN